MVRHQAISQNSRRMTLLGFVPNALERLEVGGFSKRGEPRHGAVRHVVNQAARSCAGYARHSGRLPRRGPLVKRAASPFPTRGPPHRLETHCNGTLLALPESRELHRSMRRNALASLPFFRVGREQGRASERQPDALVAVTRSWSANALRWREFARPVSQRSRGRRTFGRGRFGQSQHQRPRLGD